MGGLQTCRQMACSEIRAATLSGDCNWSREFWRGNAWQVKGHQRVCVRRRAKLSLVGVKACEGCNLDAIIDDVFESCYNDTAPFIDIPS